MNIKKYKKKVWKEKGLIFKSAWSSWQRGYLLFCRKPGGKYYPFAGSVSP